MKTATAGILAHLKRKSITPLEALDKFGCLRLAAIIYNLRQRGVLIKTAYQTVNGKTFARYSLFKE
jgi:hypothetical protein